MISRNRSAPTAAAMSIDCTTSALLTVTVNPTGRGRKFGHRSIDLVFTHDDEDR